MQIELDNERVNRLFGANRSDFGDFLREGMRFYKEHPEIKKLIETLQESNALQKKSLRIWDGQSEKQDCFNWDEVQMPVCKTLLQGRPRMPGHNVFLFYLVNTWQDGICNKDAKTLISESGTLRTLLHPSTQKIPGYTTILEHINLIDEKTASTIVQKQLKWLQRQDRSVEQWERVVVDSTAVKANATHPVDSAQLVENLHGLLREHERMRELLALEQELSCKINRWLKKIEAEHRGMSLWGNKSGKKKRIRKGYRNSLDAALKLLQCLQKYQDNHLELELKRTFQLTHAQRRALEKIRDRYNLYFDALKCVIKQACERVLKGKSLKSVEKWLSSKDRDAALIVKGHRDSNWGYKLQFAFNAAGYCTATVVNKGNEADSPSLKAVIVQSKKNTGVKVKQLSVDDGYAGKQSEREIRKLGVVDFSVSGSKGKPQHGEELWHDPVIQELRKWRSAGESRIFMIKHNQHLRRVRRSGRDAVCAEVLGKMIAYNLGNWLRGKKESLAKAA